MICCSMTAWIGSMPAFLDGGLRPCLRLSDERANRHVHVHPRVRPPRWRYDCCGVSWLIMNGVWYGGNGCQSKLWQWCFGTINNGPMQYEQWQGGFVGWSHGRHEPRAEWRHRQGIDSDWFSFTVGKIRVWDEMNGVNWRFCNFIFAFVFCSHFFVEHTSKNERAGTHTIR